MSADRVVVDLPDRDPGIPRFVTVAVACALVAAGAAALRPSQAVLSIGPAAPEEMSAPDAGLTGAGLFLREGCGECHATSGPSSALGPSLAGVGQRAQARVADPVYAGSAITADEYLREATLDHCVDLLPGYTCPDVPDLGLRLSLDQVDHIVRFMAGLEAGPAP